MKKKSAIEWEPIESGGVQIFFAGDKTAVFSTIEAVRAVVFI